jgi:hypothetical protein
MAFLHSSLKVTWEAMDENVPIVVTDWECGFFVLPVQGGYGNVVENSPQRLPTKSTWPFFRLHEPKPGTMRQLTLKNGSAEIMIYYAQNQFYRGHQDIQKLHWYKPSEKDTPLMNETHAQWRNARLDAQSIYIMSLMCEKYEILNGIIDEPDKIKRDRFRSAMLSWEMLQDDIPIVATLSHSTHHGRNGKFITVKNNVSQKWSLLSKSTWTENITFVDAKFFAADIYIDSNTTKIIYYINIDKAGGRSKSLRMQDFLRPRRPFDGDIEQETLQITDAINRQYELFFDYAGEVTSNIVNAVTHDILLSLANYNLI